MNAGHVSSEAIVEFAKRQGLNILQSNKKRFQLQFRASYPHLCVRSKTLKLTVQRVRASMVETL